MITPHAQARMQQRGLPPLVLHWLEAYGNESHDGQGAVIRHFTKQARRRLERDIGREPVRRCMNTSTPTPSTPQTAR